ncbi:MAG: SOS response-associated peptidase [Bacteroidales bacterium]|nr:SOS response-associated peptidase [Bacteroidales bacterium]
MCGRYVLVQKVETIEKRFNAKFSNAEIYKSNYNISPGQYAPIITDREPKIIQMFRFGLIPFWAKKKMTLFNARAEGDHNKNNDINYKGAKGIINKPAFRKPIRSSRCLIIANAFIEGTEKNGLNEPYLIYLQDTQLFVFAGIWDQWLDPATNELIYSFSIITTIVNSLIQQLPHKRSPVVIDKYYEQKWLNTKAPLSDITGLLQAFKSEKMNAFRISPDIKNPRENNPELLKPVEERLRPETNNILKQTLELHGMGQYKPKKKFQ